jgi:thiol-disulfide isomerase/thioredoxin
MKILKFSADWCNPCKHMTEWLKTQSYDHDIVEINVKGNEELVRQHDVRSVPTLIMLDDSDQKVKTITGFNVPKLEAFLKI